MCLGPESFDARAPEQMWPVSFGRGLPGGHDLTVKIPKAIVVPKKSFGGVLDVVSIPHSVLRASLVCPCFDPE